MRYDTTTKIYTYLSLFVSKMTQFKKFPEISQKKMENYFST